MTNELKKIKSNGNEKSVFPEHEFIASCLRIGLNITELKQMTYVEAMKVLLAYINYGETNDTKKATQQDIDKLFG